MTTQRPQRQAGVRSSARRALRRALSAGLMAATLMLSLTPLAHARDGYDPQRAGNPLRIVYYAAYPVAFLLDRLIFRPAYYIGQCQPFQTIFGTQPELSDIERETAPPKEEDSDES